MEHGRVSATHHRQQCCGVAGDDGRTGAAPSGGAPGVRPRDRRGCPRGEAAPRAAGRDHGKPHPGGRQRRINRTAHWGQSRRGAGQVSDPRPLGYAHPRGIFRRALLSAVPRQRRFRSSRCRIADPARHAAPMAPGNSGGHASRAAAPNSVGLVHHGCRKVLRRRRVRPGATPAARCPADVYHRFGRRTALRRFAESRWRRHDQAA